MSNVNNSGAQNSNGEDRFLPTQQFFMPTQQSQYVGYVAGESTRNNFSIQNIFGVIYRFRFLILLVSLLATGLSAFLASKVPPNYSATGMVIVGQYIPPIQGETGRLLNSESQKESHITTHLPLLKSYNIAEIVLSQNPEIAEYVATWKISDEFLKKEHSYYSPEVDMRAFLTGNNKEGKELEPGIVKKEGENKEQAQEINLDRSSDKFSFDALNDYLALVSYEHIKGTQTLTVSAEARNPIMAARIANAHSQAFIALVRARLLDNARVNLSFLKTRTEEAQENARKTRQALVDFAEKNALYLDLSSTGGQKQSQLSLQLDDLTSSLIQATKERTEAEAEYRLLRDSSSSTGLRADHVTRTLQVELARKEGEYLSLRKEIQNDNHPALRALKSEVKNLRQQVSSDKGAEVDQLQIRYKSLSQQEKMLNEELDRTRRSNLEESKALVKYNLLEQEDKAAQDLYRQLSRELEEVYVHLNSNQRHVTLIDPARPPKISAEKQSQVNLLIGCLLGPIVGIGLAFLLDLLDNTIRTVADLKQIVDAPLLGIIPKFQKDLEDIITEASVESVEDEMLEPAASMEGDGFGMEEGIAPVLSSSQEIAEYPIGGPSSGPTWSTMLTKRPEMSSLDPMARTQIAHRPVKSEKSFSSDAFDTMKLQEQKKPSRTSTAIITSRSLVLVSSPYSTESEAFRNVRTTVDFGNARKSPKVLLVTSSQKNDGKTTVACNLAISMAQAGKRTLVIDADLRLPAVHKSFHLSRVTPGLGNYLVGEKDYADLIFESPVPNLFLMLAGTPVATPSELIGSKRMTELVDLLNDEFDQIIIDSPPVTRVSDPLLLSRIVDGVVFVVRSGKTPQPAAEMAYSRLKQMDANILGSVLNDVDSIPGYKEADYYYVTEPYSEEESASSLAK
jgi:capsular exopolysaccharide synthesis family protein